jgi:ribosomal protein L20
MRSAAQAEEARIRLLWIAVSTRCRDLREHLQPPAQRSQIAGVNINRKVLADLAITDMNAIKITVDIAVKARV